MSAEQRYALEELAADLRAQAEAHRLAGRLERAARCAAWAELVDGLLEAAA
jgi:hypothetical protein